MCGGTLLILPCSHVGHVFRKQTPYSFPGGTNKIIFKNNRRLIDVWTDEYRNYFHKVIPDLNMVDAGTIDDRVELRKRLQCKSFRWYLDNVYPEAPLPKDFYHVGSVCQSLSLSFALSPLTMPCLDREHRLQVLPRHDEPQGGRRCGRLVLPPPRYAGSTCTRVLTHSHGLLI